MKKDAQKGKVVLNEFQVSMTEWFALLDKQKEADDFRTEDNTKDDRLEVLYQTLNMQYERPVNFKALDLVNKTEEFLKFYKEHRNGLCALRLMSKVPGLPKLRNRGLTVREVYEKWFPKQKIDHAQYTASFRPHAGTYPLSIIMVVSKEGIFGETVVGQHAQLTQGATENKTSQFSFDFKHWLWKNKTQKSEGVVKKIVKGLLVKDEKKRKYLSKSLKAKFKNDYLLGYYEAILWTDGVIRFSDFNRLLHNKLKKPNLKTQKEGISGTPVYKGKVKGVVRIVTPTNISSIKFDNKFVLVTDNTDIRFLPLMKKAAAIITDRGGILSHAAIIARELKIPCIVGAKNATKVLKDGEKVEVDANTGAVKIIK